VQQHPIDQLRRDDPARHETAGRDNARQLEVRVAEYSVAARTPVGEACAEADQQSTAEHPRQLRAVAGGERTIEHPKIPDRRPAAAEDGRERATQKEPGEKRETPRASAGDRAPPEVRLIEHHAADVLESSGHSEPAVRDEQERQRDSRNHGSRNRPVDGRKAMQDERHGRSLAVDRDLGPVLGDSPRNSRHVLCMICVQEQVSEEAHGLDQRIGALQAQLDRLTVSLQLWREQQDHLKPAEDRLADLTRQCAQIISQAGSTGERQARAVGQLEERVSAFTAAEERLYHDAADRLRGLERAIEQEWSELRQIHEAPVRELRDQADVLSRLTIAATNSSVSGFDRAEARLAEIQAALNHRLDGVSEQLAAAVAEIRAVAVRSPSVPAVPAWPIEGVVRLHNQLRESNEVAPGGGPVVMHTPAPSTPAAAPDVFARLESMEQALTQREGDLRAAATEGRSRQLRLGTVIAAVLVLIAALGGWLVQREAAAAAAKAAVAEQKARDAVAAATEQVVAVRDQSEKRIAEARQEAARAQVVSDVLAAPDLTRFPIAGSVPGGISGQVLWSRSRGVVFSGIRMPQVPAGMTYQLWLLTDGLPVTAGTFVPEGNGRVTFSVDPPRVPRPVVGAALTLEPAGGSQTPSEMLVQNRIVRPAPQE
jgi:hypothetical protein